MKLFVDSANLDDLRQALARGFVAGVTTNPSILAREQGVDFADHLHAIVELLRAHGGDLPLSVEVFVEDPAEMLDQALKFVALFDYPGLSVKVPVGWAELGVIAELRRRDIAVNCTCCMTFSQAYMAALAGARYVSLFWGRIRDIGGDPHAVVEQTARAFRAGGIRSEIIVGSIRHFQDVDAALLAGADIVTVPPQFFPQMVQHPKTTEAVQQFLADARAWLRRS
jgi:transaldolase